MKISVLPNHVTLFYERIRVNKSVCVNLSFARSFHECVPKPHGLELPSDTAHLSEHLIMNNSTKLLSRSERKKQKNRFYNLNAATTSFYVSFFAQLSREDVVPFLTYIADGITNLQLSEEELAKEKQVIENEKLRGFKNKKFSFLNVPAMLPKAYAKQLDEDSRCDVQQVSIQDIQTFMKETFVQPRLYIFISGNISGRKIKAWLYKHFISKLPAEQQRERITYKEAVQDVKTNMFMHFYENKHKLGHVFCEFILPYVSSNTLQENCIEKLMNALIKQEAWKFFREERGLCYASNVEYITYKCRLSLFLELESKFENIETIQNLLPEFFARVCTKTFTTEEIIRAKQFIKAQTDAYVCRPYMRRNCFTESIKYNKIVPYYSSEKIYKSILKDINTYVKICEKRLQEFIKADISMCVYAKEDTLEPMPSFKKRLHKYIKLQKQKIVNGEKRK